MQICFHICICMYIFPQKLFLLFSWVGFCSEKNCTAFSGELSMATPLCFKIQLVHHLSPKNLFFLLLFLLSEPAIHLPFIHVQNSELSFHSSPSTWQAIRCQLLQSLTAIGDPLIWSFFSSLSRPFRAGSFCLFYPQKSCWTNLPAYSLSLLDAVFIPPPN